MSLLLDALKKAAKDKEQARAAGEAGSNAEPGETGPDQEAPHEFSLEEDNRQENTNPPREGADAAPEHDHEEQALSLEPEEVHTASTTVSDEALQMLVYKTNREHRRKQRIIWFGVTIASVAILLTGGFYFYNRMVEDVEALERRHRIALQQVNAEVIKRKHPELIAGLTGKPDKEAAVPGKAEQAPATMAAASRPAKPATQQAATAKPRPADKRQAAPITLTMNRRQDPVNDLLQKGWNAYNAQRYVPAAGMYGKVLEREPNNRDALLGMAAIAVAGDDSETAARYYRRLLEIDPRDPVAVPAMASLQQQSLDAMGETRLKVLLRQQPGAAQVNFTLGNIKAGQQAWPEAQQYYFDAWQAEPGNPDYAFNLAVSLEHIGKPAEALGYYDRSIALAAGSLHRFDIDTAKRRAEELRKRP